MDLLGKHVNELLFSLDAFNKCMSPIDLERSVGSGVFSVKIKTISYTSISIL